MHSTISEANKAIVAYVPALHSGYLSFFRLHPEVPIFILGTTFIDAYPRLNRDLRALTPQEAQRSLAALGFEVYVLESIHDSAFTSYTSYVLPDEDVSRDFATKYLSDKTVALESIFLRWDGVFSNKQNEVSPDRKVTHEELHKAFIRDAYTESKQSADWWRQIGAVLVLDGHPKAYGHIRYFPSDLSLDIFGTPRITVDFGERPDLYISMHAEADTISQAAREGITLKGASLYTTTFPCINCAFLIARSGISKVYYTEGYSNLNAEDILKNAAVEIILVQNPLS